MKKRIFALFLILVFALSCFTACGDKDDDNSDKKKKAKSYDDVYEMIEDMGTFEKGTVTMSMDADLGEKGTAKMTAKIVSDGKNNYAIGITLDVDSVKEQFNIDIDDFMIVKDAMAYINLGGLVKALTAVEPQVGEMLSGVKLGYFAIPLPDEFNQKKSTEVMKETVELCTKFLKRGFKDAKVKGEKDEFTITFDNPDAYRTLLNELADFIEDDFQDYVDKNMDDFTSNDIDYNAYVKKLIDYYYDDIVVLADAFGADKATIDQAIAEIKKMDLNEQVGGYLNSELDMDDLYKELKDAAKEIRRAADNVSDEDFEKVESKITLKSTDSGFTARVSVDGIEVEGTEAKVTIEIKVSDSVGKISKPGDITKLRDFKDLIAQFGGMF